MHRSLIAIALSTLAALTATACNEEDPPALYLDVEYQLRCIDCEPRGGDGPRRDVQVVDGEDGASLKCYMEGGLMTLELESDDFSFKILRARLNEDDPGGSCEVVVSEGSGSEYSGGCRDFGDGESTAPCELELNSDGDVISGNLKCTNIRHSLTADYERYVVTPNGDDPVEITIQGCSGL